MESAFDGFFEKHHLKLQQYLQLLRYEHSFQEVRLTVYVMDGLLINWPMPRGNS